ncbi:MAG TPA: DUF2865 domain-containing protein [Hyphomicrobiaceae bacterium]|nr:DUF2865 domain-containing protein [Hyphomicrobiaceae bacterium]
MGQGKGRQRTALGVALGLCLAAVAIASSDALAQGWGWWPWSQPDPRPREPVYRDPPDRLAPGQPPPGQQPPPGTYPPGTYPPGQQQGGWGQRSNICVQLERRLVAETQGSNQGRELLPKLEADMRELERSYQLAQQQLNRNDCWDQFLFSRTLRRTPRCVRLAAEVDATRQRLADLDAQRRQIMGTRDRSFQDDIIRELARNGCGQQYVAENRRRSAARNPFSSLFGEEESEGERGSPNQFGNLPFATYRTLCVRLCDGYYFPVSFSTLPNHFQRDAEVCQSQCAAPAQLYYHQNPGGSVEQMVSVNDQQPYTSLKSAWRYRKEYVQGCSCKAAEYQPALVGDRKADVPPSTGGSGGTARLSAKQ